MGARVVYGKIYCVTNLANGKQYVGQTVGNIHDRWRHGEKSRSSLGAAFRKYGKQNFKIGYVCYTTSAKSLDAAEIRWIERFATLAPSGYNLTTGGRKQGRFSDISKSKMSASQRASWVDGKKRQKLSTATKLNWDSKEYRERQTKQIQAGAKKNRDKYSDAQKRNWMDREYRERLTAARRARPLPSEEFREKMKEAARRGWINRRLRSGDHRNG